MELPRCYINNIQYEAGQVIDVNDVVQVKLSTFETELEIYDKDDNIIRIPTSIRRLVVLINELLENR